MLVGVSGLGHWCRKFIIAGGTTTAPTALCHFVYIHTSKIRGARTSPAPRFLLLCGMYKEGGHSKHLFDCWKGCSCFCTPLNVLDITVGVWKEMIKLLKNSSRGWEKMMVVMYELNELLELHCEVGWGMLQSRSSSIGTPKTFGRIPLCSTQVMTSLYELTSMCNTIQSPSCATSTVVVVVPKHYLTAAVQISFPVHDTSSPTL